MTTIEEVRQIKRAVEMDLMAHPGVFGVDIRRDRTADEERYIILVMIASDGPEGVEDRIPREIQGVPIEKKRVPRFVPQA